MLALDQSVMERHSTRMFLPQPVLRELLEEALALAQHAPSNSNIQPWRLVFVSGIASNRPRDALFKVADYEAPHIPALPKAFEHYRNELGAEVYSSMGYPDRGHGKTCGCGDAQLSIFSAHRWSASSACIGTLARPML